jgi:hypothetical protein
VPRHWDREPIPLQRALPRGQRWLALLESGEVKSLREIARKEGVDSSYVSRMVNVATLAPDILAVGPRRDLTAGPYAVSIGGGSAGGVGGAAAEASGSTLSNAAPHV